MTDDFDHRLADLAEHGHRTGRLEPASVLRARGDRRRRRRYAATAAFGVVLAAALGAGIALAQPNGTTSPTPAGPVSGPVTTEPSVPPSPQPSTPPSSTPSRSTTSRPPSSPPNTGTGGADVLSGKRQVYIVPMDNGAELPLTTLGVDDNNRVNVTDDFGDRAGFVPVPTAPKSRKHLIKTAEIRSGGEALCLQVQGNGSNPLTLVTKACDAANSDQVFQFRKQGEGDDGQAVYLIEVNGLFLHYSKGSRYGLIVQESGEGDDLTSFVVADNRAAQLPPLD